MIGTIRPGATSQEVDRAGRGVMARGGLGEEFRHRAGYSMGVAFAPSRWKNSRGCGSNVITAGVRSRARAAATTRISSAWWPR